MKFLRHLFIKESIFIFMKIIITVKTGKGDKSTEKEIDKTVGILERILFTLDKKFKNYRWSKFKAMCDGTQIVLEK